MNCPACGRLMVPDIRDQVISCGAGSVIVKAIKGNFCPNCDEGILDPESYQRLTEAQRDLVNAVRIEAGAEIRRIRKRLKLTQTQLAENFGLGPLAFSRYERGKTRPPVVLLKLMRLLENHPDLVEEALKAEPTYCVEPTVSDTPP
jgi:HTH-type transcriptional regulator / antitoxin MqsA